MSRRGRRYETKPLPSSNYGYDNETHHLIQIKVPPPSLIALRDELAKPENKDISDYAIQGNTFEECVGRIAEKLDILLDGLYDGADLCDLLVSAMRSRGTHLAQPHKRDSRLVNAELVETENEVTVTQIEDNAVTLAPSQLTEVKDCGPNLMNCPTPTECDAHGGCMRIPEVTETSEPQSKQE